MYCYYQITGKDTWRPVKLGPGTEKEVKELGATKLTILAVNEIVADETDPEKLAYKGPLYFDIDVKEDLNLAIKSTKKLVEKIIELQVPVEAIHIYASGSKGMHVIIPEKIFSSGRQVKGLPYIYAEMALRLDVLGLDYQVYSGGKGVCWRLSNVQRDDGNYRVPVTYEELQELDSEKYAEYVKAPRDVEFADTEGMTSAGLAVLFDQARKIVKSKPRQIKVVSDSALAKFTTEPPNCITDLLDYKVKEDANFNAIALQIAIFNARSGTTHHETYASRLAKNGHSSQYNNEWKREAHVLGLTKYTKYKKSKKFSCAAIVSLLKSRPCEGCPLAANFTEEDQFAQEMELIEKFDGYYIPGEHRDKPITNFIIEPIAVYMDVSNIGHSDRRAGALVEYKQQGMVVGKSLFQEAGWISKAGFKSQILGISNALSFTGSEDDVHRIMRMVYNGDKDVDTIIQTYTLGVLFHKVGDRDISVYVEPGYSINQLGLRDTHNLEGNIMGAQQLVDTRPAKKADMELNAVIDNLIKVNSPKIVAQILGWFSACHLHSHFMHKYKQFPILNLWGNAGAGKSRTTDLFGWLCGMDDMRSNTSINLSSITPWPIIEFCSTSTTIPRILEEYNKSKLTARMYTLAGEIIKCAWDGQNLPRGTLSGSKANGKGRTGASVVALPITAPLVVISEQASTMPAHLHRMVQILMNSSTREGCEETFMAACNGREKLKPLAKSLVISALNTDMNWIDKAMQNNAKFVPNVLEDRPKYSYKLLMVGLDFLCNTLDALDLPVANEVRNLKEAMKQDLAETAEEMARAKKQTEIDSVLHDLAMMAGMTDSISPTVGSNWLVAGKHYVKKGDKLVIDAPIVHTLYKKYKNGINETVVIESTQQFIQLLAQEPYFESANYPAPEIVKGRSMTLLDVDKLKEKGIMVEMFLES